MDKLIIWCVVGRECGTPLTQYIGDTEACTARAVLEKARSEGFTGDLQSRLDMLGWDIVEFQCERTGKKHG